MKFIKNFGRAIWRIWFYGWVFFSVLAVFPVLLIIVSKEKWYPVFYKIARAWSKTILFIMGFRVDMEKEGRLEKGKSYLFCPNHTSMMDVMLMFVLSENPFVFIGKKEIAKVPVFGYFYKKTNILVDRGNRDSRKQVIEEANRRLSSGMSICIFPEGLVPDDENVVLSDFKNGAFRLAIEHQIPIVPVTLYDCKRLFSFTFFSGKPGVLRAKLHTIIPTVGMESKQRNSLKKQTFSLIYDELILDLKD
ncbi:MAG: 1-acyl-sn-glycerol-3-phosphate acyltransferase [Flavobacteriaceae bacterium]|nr:MAG: 1-acyl-sn-glycerol-3-phosphate acyltransferase [Flavobacteriaceae bacterium]